MGGNVLWYSDTQPSGGRYVYALSLETTPWADGDITPNTHAALSLQFVRSPSRKATEGDRKMIANGKGTLAELYGQNPKLITAIFRHYGQDIHEWLHTRRFEESDLLKEISQLRYNHDAYPSSDWDHTRRSAIDRLAQSTDAAFDRAICGALDAAARLDIDPAVRTKAETALKSRGCDGKK